MNFFGVVCLELSNRRGFKAKSTYKSFFIWIYLVICKGLLGDIGYIWYLQAQGFSISYINGDLQNLLYESIVDIIWFCLKLPRGELDAYRRFQHLTSPSKLYSNRVGFKRNDPYKDCLFLIVLVISKVKLECYLIQLVLETRVGLVSTISMAIYNFTLLIKCRYYRQGILMFCSQSGSYRRF